MNASWMNVRCRFLLPLIALLLSSCAAPPPITKTVYVPKVETVYIPSPTASIRLPPVLASECVKPTPFDLHNPTTKQLVNAYLSALGAWKACAIRYSAVLRHIEDWEDVNEETYDNVAAPH